MCFRNKNLLKVIGALSRFGPGFKQRLLMDSAEGFL